MKKKVMKKRWNIFVNFSRPLFYTVRADSFDEAIHIARKLFPKLNVTGAQRV